VTHDSGQTTTIDNNTATLIVTHDNDGQEKWKTMMDMTHINDTTN